jgi:hypothetical protein
MEDKANYQRKKDGNRSEGEIALPTWKVRKHVVPRSQDPCRDEIAACPVGQALNCWESVGMRYLISAPRRFKFVCMQSS